MEFDISDHEVPMRIPAHVFTLWICGSAAAAVLPHAAAQQGPQIPSGTVRNPSDPREATTEGERIYESSRCALCHGADGRGGMGPDLTDAEWMYGESDSDVFRSIAEGRPGGMPAWRSKLKEDEIWKLISYLRSLS